MVGTGGVFGKKKIPKKRGGGYAPQDGVIY